MDRLIGSISFAGVPAAQPFRAARRPIAGLKACATRGRRQFRCARSISHLTAVLVALTVVHAQPALEPHTYDPALFKALRWRSIGPYRGGRVTAVAGVPGQPPVYYMGATGGGVWKTDDAGITWNPVTDGYVKTGSVG